MAKPGRPKTCRAVDEWTKKNKIGDRVMFTTSDRRVIQTTTESQAYMCRWGAVIDLEGFSGQPVPLERVRAL
jgi:hypothetical protein